MAVCDVEHPGEVDVVVWFWGSRFEEEALHPARAEYYDAPAGPMTDVATAVHNTPGDVHALASGQQPWLTSEDHLELSFYDMDRFGVGPVPVRGQRPPGRRVIDEQAQGTIRFVAAGVDLGPNATRHPYNQRPRAHVQTISTQRPIA